jgi:hypothetical protein
VKRLAPLLAVAGLLAAQPVSGDEFPEAIVVLEAADGFPDSVPSGAPPRFVLGRDRRVFLGGSEKIYAGLLDRDEVKAIERRIKDLRKSGLLQPSVSFGDDTGKRYRLRLPREEVSDVLMTGDPASAPPGMRGLATFVNDLLRFDHPSLRPWAPTEFLVTAREGELVGGCRAWLLPTPFESIVAGPQRIPVAGAERWPAGSDPASVCHDGRRYVVTFRPLLPGERP